MLTTPPRKKKNVKNYPLDEMLPLETKQSGGKLLPHSDLRGGGVFLEEVSRSRKRIKEGRMAVSCGYGEELSGSLNAGNF